MAIKIVQVTSDADLEKFINFPNDLYRDNPYFVPALIKEEKAIWDPRQNPALAYSLAKKFLAYRNGEVAGRIAVIINKKEVSELGVHKVRFGWFDFMNDQEVCKALLQQAINFARENNMPYIEGPMGFTNLDKAGMLVKGFDRLATMIGLYNSEYYPILLERLGMQKSKEWVEFEIEFPDVLPEKVIKFNELIKQKYKLRVLHFDHKKQILPLVEPIFRLLDETYKGLSTYTPITEEQIQNYREKYFGFIDKDYVVCIADQQDELIAFAITMPSYSKALQKANGKLFPFGWYHLWRAGQKNDRANFYLIGIHPAYQRRGITSVIFKEIFEIFRKKGIRFLETNPELEENKNIQLLWSDYSPVNHKRRRTYSISVDEWQKSE